jgi:putative nucleotidyltransferase with HDIG domain
MDLIKALEILTSYNLPEHIIAHSYKVTKVSWIISNEIANKGINIDLELILYSSLLHDITKYDAIINKGEDHAETGGKFLRKLGYDNIADVVENHIVIKDKKKFLLEKKIVFYSDKRVMHDKIVSLKTRYDDLSARYGKSKFSRIMIKNGLKRALKIEKEIFQYIDFTPELINILI